MAVITNRDIARLATSIRQVVSLSAPEQHLNFAICDGLRPLTRATGALFGATVILLGLASATADAQIFQGGTIKGQFGHWQVICKAPPPGAKNEVCGAVQSVTSEDNDNIGLTAIVQKYSDGKITMRVVTSLGVFLGKALGVQIDNAHEGHIPFDRCLPIGCQAQLLLEPPLVTKLKSGKTLLFIIYRTQENGIGIPVSLEGFGQAINGLR